MKARDKNPNVRVDEEPEDERPLGTGEEVKPDRMAGRSIRMRTTRCSSWRAARVPAGYGSPSSSS